MSRRREQRYRPESAPRVELAIDDVDDEGRGVGRVHGKVVFVDGALPGERVRARYRRTSRRADEAVTEAVLAPSPDRATPFCPVFDRCGGCTLQHWAASGQRRHRDARVRWLLERAAGHSAGRWLSPVTGPERAYRMRARWGCRAADGGVTLGFREEGGRRIVDADGCPVLDDRLSALMGPLKATLAGLERCRRVGEVEACASEAETAVGLAMDGPLGVGDAKRLREFAGREGVRVALRAGDGPAFEPVPGTAAPDLVYTLPAEGLSLRFALGDFVQANPAVNRGLVAHAMGLLAPEPGMRVLDLFTGVGNFALPAARRGADVVGLEGNAGLVERATANAAVNGLGQRAGFELTDLAGDDAGARIRAVAPDAVVIDPPRAGAGPVVAALAEQRPPRIVYVSCEPATLARDVATLAGGGYRLTAAGIAEMFPHTSHVEAIACLEYPHG